MIFICYSINAFYSKISVGLKISWPSLTYMFSTRAYLRQRSWHRRLWGRRSSVRCRHRGCQGSCSRPTSSVCRPRCRQSVPRRHVPSLPPAFPQCGFVIGRFLPAGRIVCRIVCSCFSCFPGCCLCSVLYLVGLFISPASFCRS